MPKTNAECCRDYRKRKRENKIKKKVKSATERVREYRARRKALLNMQNGSFITYNDDFTVQNSESVHSSEKKMDNLHKSINPGNTTYVDTKIMTIKQEHSSYETANLVTKPTVLPVEFQYIAPNIQDTIKCDNSEDTKEVNYDRINVKKEVLSDDSDTDTVLPVSVEVKDSNAQSIKSEDITIACSICFMEFTNEYEYNEHVHVQRSPVHSPAITTSRKTNADYCRDYRKRKRENNIKNTVKSTMEPVREYCAPQKALLNVQNDSSITHNVDFPIQNSESDQSSEKKMVIIHKSINHGNATYVATKTMTIKQEPSSYESADLDTKPTVLPVEFQYNAPNIQDTNKCENSKDTKDVNYDLVNVKKEVLSDDSDTDAMLPVSVEVKDSNAQSIKCEDITIACNICFMEFTNEYDYNEHVHVQCQLPSSSRTNAQAPHTSSSSDSALGTGHRHPVQTLSGNDSTTDSTQTRVAHLPASVGSRKAEESSSNRNESPKISQETISSEKPFKCSLCEYKCNEGDRFTNHMRIHTGVKTYSCSYCDYECNEISKLTRHMRSHTGEKPFTCSVCYHKFSLTSSLVSHMRTHTGVKPYSCNVCRYKCNSSNSLIIHMRTHTGEKPFACCFCDYKCSVNSSLICHMRTHSNDKPFACNLCDYKCKVRSSLTRHLRIHVGKTLFVCSLCNYQCGLKRNITRHIRRAHTAK